MPRKSKPRSRSCGRMLPIMHPDAAGIDIGSEEIFVSVPPGRDTDSVRHFATFTRDLLALADWLHQCNIRSVAMESTGVYWIPSPVNVTREENVAAPKKGNAAVIQVAAERSRSTRTSAHQRAAIAKLRHALALRQGCEPTA